MAPVAVVSRSLSPTAAPRSFASSVPISTPVVPSSTLPATTFSFSATTAKYVSGSMPVIDTARLASPRSAKPGPDTTGVAAVTSGRRTIAASAFCHWSIDRSCCERGCTIAASAAPSPRSGRATRSGADTTIGA